MPDVAQDVADGDWYLRTEASDGAQGLSLLPEVPAYGALPTIGALAARSTSGLAFAHIERIDAECGGEAARSNLAHRDDCHRAWVAATADEVTVGANPGVAFSGDTTGLYVGADIFGHDTATHTVRGGVFAGQQRGNHWTTGEASGGVLGAGAAQFAAVARESFTDAMAIAMTTGLIGAAAGALVAVFVLPRRSAVAD